MPPSAWRTSPPVIVVTPPPMTPLAWPAWPNETSTAPGPAAWAMGTATSDSAATAAPTSFLMPRRTPSRERSCAALVAQAELAPVLLAVLVLLLLDARHVGAGLGERDVLVGRELLGAAGLVHPPVDVGLSGVVGRDGQPLVAVVVVEEVAEVPGPVGDVDLRVSQV